MSKTESSLRVEPAWIKHDKQVLRYTCFFKEPVLESPDEKFRYFFPCFVSLPQYRVRQLLVSFFLEDGTIQVSEPAVENSGIVPGPFLRRHQILKADGELLGLKDLTCGKDIELYSRVVRVASMDEYTRQFYLNSNIEPGVELPVPVDPFTSARIRASEKRPLPADVIREKALVNIMFGGHEINRKTKQYLEKDGKVLRFYCYWDDPSDDGYRHFFELHWFLADDTLELVEVFERTDSCAAARAVFLKRGSPSMFGSSVSCSSLRTGSMITISERSLFLFDCDPFTRDYYVQELGAAQEAVFVKRAEGRQAVLVPEELRLIPRRPRTDPSKLDKAGVTLRFEARLLQGDSRRKFTIGFYPMDESLAVWEIPVRNSGIVAGKFAERSKKLKPDGNHYRLADLCVGAQIVVSATVFEISACDEFTLGWIRDHCCFYKLELVLYAFTCSWD